MTEAPKGRAAVTEQSEEHRGSMEINEISGAVVDAAMRIHSRLGPGLLEQPYKKCLE